MPTFRVHRAPNPPFEVQAEDWVDALETAFSQLKLTEDVDCTVLLSGDIDVQTASGGFRLQELAAPAVAEAAVPEAVARPRLTPVRLGPVAASLPAESSALLDAPDPTQTPAWSTREEVGEERLAEIAERALVVLSAETASDAASVGLSLLLEFIPAESAAVLLADRRTRDLRFTAARGPRSAGLVGLVVPAGRGIAGLAMRAGVAVNMREARLDPRHYSEVDRATGYHTHGILCVPIRGKGELVGCLQLLNPFAGTFAFWHQAAAQIVAARISERVG